MKFEIWIEGYAATGQHSPASKIGEAEGETFLEACQNFREPEDVMSWDKKSVLVAKGTALKLDTNHDDTLRLDKEGRPSIWACRLYDNEADARKSFG